MDTAELIEELRKIQNEREQRQKSLVLLSKFVDWLAVDHPQFLLKRGRGTTPCMSKGTESIKNYTSQMRLYLRKVGGVSITSEDVEEYISYPQQINKEEVEPLLLTEFKKICDKASPKRSLMYRIIKDCEARIGATVQLRRKHFDITKRPIEVFFPKHIMKKKKGVSYSNTKFVIEEDERDLLDYLETLKNPESLVFGTTEDWHTAKSTEEAYWQRLMVKVGFTQRYEHNGYLKKSLHTIKSLTFTAAEEAVNETFANAYGDHSRYIRNYLRWTKEKKIEKFKLLEPYISFTKTEKSGKDSKLELENTILTKKLAETSKILTDHDKMLKKYIDVELAKTSVKVDEKTREMMTQLLKENNLL